MIPEDTIFRDLLAACETPVPDWGRVAVLADRAAEIGEDNWEFTLRVLPKNGWWPQRSDWSMKDYYWDTSIPLWIHRSILDAGPSYGSVAESLTKMKRLLATIRKDLHL